MKKVKLFCIPYAGGSAFVYYKMKQYLNASIELCPVELAGRGKRMRTPCYESIDEAVDDICGIIREKIDDSPYALFGHSMGGILAYEAQNRLIKAGKNAPVHLFLSAVRPPHLMGRQKVLHTLPDDEFIVEILKFGGTDRRVFENDELSEFFIRLLKSDLKIIETYRYDKEYEVTKTDITALSGKDDNITYDEMSEWEKYTSGKFKIFQFGGNHFFINSCTKEVADVINHEIAVDSGYEYQVTKTL
ncbi:linear gramicidin dehydrogenase LgrE [[Clostridium] cellulosi]|jgi:Thioesterase domain.|uniref:Linear gramicidin dehydrogenase LgrE n=1 Tax=[Clostridium] cellulosi TaxID=29343 RepID=A0A078KK39_9FIRM|nr:MAG: thioesterase [[Clostridium] cellulosi]CDZ24031.1 linear gramicidin dehydrogenase LgrE [[Clostridium] cellulosi]